MYVIKIKNIFATLMVTKYELYANEIAIFETKIFRNCNIEYTVKFDITEPQYNGT